MNRLFLLTSLLHISSISAWTPKSPVKYTLRRLSRDRFMTSLRSSAGDSNILGGVSSFESWFQGVDGASRKEGVSHANFGNLRGLTYAHENDGSDVMTIPKSIVLDSDFSQPDWDAHLASKLWAECTKGSSSFISGYIELLTQSKWTAADLPSIPPSTAPDALRHWNKDQLLALKENPAGERLLGLMETQDHIWRSKFAAADSNMTWEQFRWAMEVVHSRAFRGDFGVKGGVPRALLLSIPGLAALTGYCYYIVLHGQNDVILVLLALLAGTPALLSAISNEAPAAVLLPLIDSANHSEDAGSMINYNQLGESFSLSARNNCIVDTNGKKQLFISYGNKKDTELLLNYGFLQGVDVSDSSPDVRRKKLAEAFLSRQK